MRSLQYANSMHSMHPSLLGSVKMSRINPVHSLRRRRPPLWLRPDLSRVCAIQGISQTTSLGLSLLQHDAVAFAGVLATAFVWIKLAGLLTERKLVDKTLGRKIVHITTAPMFLICWIFFSSANEARYFAALVPLINLGRTLVTGIGVVQDRDFIRSMTRQGSSAELLLGPSFYAMTLVSMTILFWRSSWVSFLTVGILAGGDGMAEIIGRRLGRNKLPYNKDKSVEGTLAMIIFGFLFSIGLMRLFHWIGFLPLMWNGQRVPYLWTFGVSVCCALVESLPFSSKVDDNISVPIASTLLGFTIEKFIS